MYVTGKFINSHREPKLPILLPSLMSSLARQPINISTMRSFAANRPFQHSSLLYTVRMDDDSSLPLAPAMQLGSAFGSDLVIPNFPVFPFEPDLARNAPPSHDLYVMCVRTEDEAGGKKLVQLHEWSSMAGFFKYMLYMHGDGRHC